MALSKRRKQRIKLFYLHYVQQLNLQGGGRSQRHCVVLRVKPCDWRYQRLWRDPKNLLLQIHYYFNKSEQTGCFQDAGIWFVSGLSVLQAHKNCQNMTEIEAKVSYVKLARSLKTYGVSFFLVKVRGASSLDCWLNEEGKTGRTDDSLFSVVFALIVGFWRYLYHSSLPPVNQL